MWVFGRGGVRMQCWEEDRQKYHTPWQAVRALSFKLRGLSPLSSNPAAVVLIHKRKFASLLAEGWFSLSGCICNQILSPTIKPWCHHITNRLLSMALKKWNQIRSITLKYPKLSNDKAPALGMYCISRSSKLGNCKIYWWKRKYFDLSLFHFYSPIWRQLAILLCFFSVGSSICWYTFSFHFVVD